MSKSTPNALTKKTASAPSRNTCYTIRMKHTFRVRKHIWISAICLVAAGLVFLVVVNVLPGLHRPDLKPVEFKGGTAYLRIVDTVEARSQGLSGVKKLAPDEGMLFDFQQDDKWGIWMKDMSIPIDIIWLNKNKEVIYIVRDAQPSLSTSKIFTPQKAARYVIELNSGAASRYMVNIGDMVRFE